MSLLWSSFSLLIKWPVAEFFDFMNLFLALRKGLPFYAARISLSASSVIKWWLVFRELLFWVRHGDCNNSLVKCLNKAADKSQNYSLSPRDRLLKLMREPRTLPSDISWNYVASQGSALQGRKTKLNIFCGENSRSMSNLAKNTLDLQLNIHLYFKNFTARVSSCLTCEFF